MNRKILKLFCMLIFNNNLYGVNPFLLNDGIVDIGRISTTNQIEVPKELVLKEPQIEEVPNKTIYNERLQSPLVDCETDFLGTEICPTNRQECPSNEELTDGYSTVHHINKSFIKLCEPGHIKNANRCYVDENGDGQKDYTYYRKTGGYKWSGVYLSGSRSVSRKGTVTIPAYGYLEVRHYSPQACDDDNNYVRIDIEGITIKSTWCGGSRDTGYIKAYENTTGSPKNIDYYYYDRHSGGGWDKSYFLEYIYAPHGTVPIGYITEEISGKIYYYKNSTCPSNTEEQPDGSCKMEYDWYSYHCPTESNYYENLWQVVNTGEDCGNASCTNSATPPENNCVRVDFVCPIDSNLKCGKTVVDTVDCGDGYVWNNNRCERLESYCASSTYNSAKDICEDIATYTKLCINDGDVYSTSLNKCISNTEICKDGTYDSVTHSCITPFEAACNSTGYIYDSFTETCSDSSIALCSDNQYSYNSGTSQCIGTMTPCVTGYSYNVKTNKCELERCGSLGTLDTDLRCEKDSACVGTVTADGKCIPSVVQN